MPATALEQMILELINRARLDPAAEAARDGIDLNEGLSAGTISAASKQPLAMNETLLTIARAHDQDMIAHNYFGHTDSSGHDPFQRMTAAGYNYTTAGENIAWNGTSGTVTTQMSLDLETLLFVDSGISGRGHRLNLLNGAFQEVGDGVANGAFMGFNATLLTQDFGTAGTGQFLTGVSYVDSDHNNFYSIGEGRNGVSVAVTGGGATATAGAGGYSVAIASGQQTVTFSGGGLSSPVSVAVTILAGTNAKVDMVDQGVVDTSASLADLGGATRIIGLGTTGLTLTGNASAETFVVNKGNDTILGGGGIDSVVFSGAKSAYTITRLAGGNLRVSGPEGTDTLSSIERLVFSDQTVNAPLIPSQDFNGDGKSDLLLQNASGVVVVGEVKSGAESYTQVAALGPEWSFKGNGDFLGDGHEDFLIENTSGAVYVGEVSNGTTTYTGVAGLGSEWKFEGTGDFLNNGQAQFLIENTSGAVYVGNVVGGQTQYTEVAGLGPEWSFKGTGDFLGDGKTDFLIESTSGAVYVGEVSNGTAAYTGVAGLGPEWKFEGTGDFLGNGHDQFLIENTNGAVDVANVVNGQAQYTQVGALGQEWSFIGTGDYLGTGTAGLMIENTAGAVVLGTIANGQASYAQVGALGPEWTSHSHK